jgi:cell division cycle protein 37
MRSAEATRRWPNDVCTNLCSSTIADNSGVTVLGCFSKSQFTITYFIVLWLILRMISQNPKSIGMFLQDLEQTYGRIESRTKELILEDSQTEREQIQLVAQDDNTTIAFNLPDGPPPAELRLEGEGTEELDIEQVRAFLQRKWDIFQSFDEDFRSALLTEKLDEVNKVLGKMKVSKAEEVVELMQEGGMLSFR